jgi:hypothetical protein
MTLAQAASTSFVERNGELLAVAGALIGALVGYMLRGRQWRRERRHQTYTDFLVAQRNHEEALRDLWSGVATGKPRDEIRARLPIVAEQRRALDHAYAAVALIAGLRTLRAADAVYEIVKDAEKVIGSAAISSRLPELDLDEGNRALTQAVAEFAMAGGKDIGNRRRARRRSELLIPRVPAA